MIIENEEKGYRERKVSRFDTASGNGCDAKNFTNLRNFSKRMEISRLLKSETITPLFLMRIPAWRS